MNAFPIRERILNAAYELPTRPTRDVDHLPGPRGNWLAGHARRFAADDARYIAEMTRLYGNVFKFPVPLGGRIVVMTGAAANRRILTRPGETISNHNGYAQAGLFGDSIVTRDFEDHAELRRLIAPAFAKPALRRYFEVIHRLIGEHLGSLRPSAAKSLDIYPVAKRLALDVAAQVFAGMDLGADRGRLDASLASILEMVSVRVPLRIPGGVYDRGVRGRRFASRFFAAEIPARRTGIGNDFFSLLCRAENEVGARLGEGEIIDNVIGAMIAGHDTTTIAISALAYELARHPVWQERVRKECSQAVDASPADTLSFEAAPRLESLESCAKEVLRLYSPIRYVQRRVVHEFDFEGHRIPRNATVLLSIHHTHHDSAYFESPEAFRPERFAASPGDLAFDPEAWAPFGKGPHVCMGMGFAMLEIKAFYCALLARYRLELPQSYRLVVEGLPVSTPRGGVPIRFVPID